MNVINNRMELKYPKTERKIDFSQLKEVIKTIIPDYENDIRLGVGTLAGSFCHKIIFQVEPESFKARKSLGFKEWLIRLPFQNKKHILCITNADIEPKIEATSLKLSVVQAVLLAQLPLCRLIKFDFNNNKNKKLIAPYIKKHFKIDKLLILAQKLKMQEVDLWIEMTQSGVIGGQNLPDSDASIAIVFILLRTQKLEIHKRNFIVRKCIKEYTKFNKLPNYKKVMIVAEFALWDICPEYISGLIEQVNLIQKAQLTGTIDSASYKTDLEEINKKYPSWKSSNPTKPTMERICAGLEELIESEFKYYNVKGKKEN